MLDCFFRLRYVFISLLYYSKFDKNVDIGLHAEVRLQVIIWWSKMDIMTVF